MPTISVPTRLLPHRITIERLVAAGTTPRGNPLETWQVIAAGVPAHVSSRRRTEAADAMRTVVVDEVRVIVRRDVDVTERDRLVDIRTASGDTYLPGVLYVRGVEPRPTHLELICTGTAA